MDKRHLEVAIAAGGTAGHINPALALAEELRDRGHHVTFYGQTAKLEGRLVPEAGFELVPVVVSGFDRARPWTLVSSLARMRRAQSQIAARFKEKGAPDVAVGFGAYVEMALLNCCHRLGVPYVLHEQNSVPGLANKALAPHAAAVVARRAVADALAAAGVPEHALVRLPDSGGWCDVPLPTAGAGAGAQCYIEHELANKRVAMRRVGAGLEHTALVGVLPPGTVAAHRACGRAAAGHRGAAPARQHVPHHQHTTNISIIRD